MKTSALPTLALPALLPALLPFWTLTSASPTPTAHPSTPPPPPPPPPPLPLLIWHGLGDRYDAPGLRSVGALASQVHPGTQVSYIRLHDGADADADATFFGNVTEQLRHVCRAVSDDERIPRGRDGRKRVDALGFSQGGQFLRGLVETCGGVSVRSLVTFGAQHNGIADVKPCGPWDLLCRAAVALMKGNAWSEYVQGHVVPAQYFRTLNATTGEASQQYLEKSNFLAEINNERQHDLSETYKKRLEEVERFVMFVFEEDATVIPKESGWFAEVDATDGRVTPLQERRIYKEDWLGLKKLDEKGALVFKTTPGDHMQLDDDVLVETFKEYYGLDEPTRFRPVAADNGRFVFRHQSMWPEGAKVSGRMTEWTKAIKQYL